ncbi:MAG: sulfotransferase family 2 domain-containing protein [Methylovulum sp.]|nr:sulfotransferase family 2 domain-containing protein [Methylovulum sp.]
MAIINHSYKFIFVHVPKTAGTSLTSALEKYTHYCDLEIGGTVFGEQIQPAYRKRFGLAKHSPAAEIRNMIGTVAWAQAFTFSFVRNPFSRCLSTYHFLRKWEGHNPELSNKIKKFNSFDEYVLSDIWQDTNGPDEIFRPQIYWLRGKINTNAILVDFVGHVERIDEDFSYILNAIGIPKHKHPTSLPKLNSSQASSIADIKNDAVIEKIVAKYRADFETFNYPCSPY